MLTRLAHLLAPDYCCNCRKIGQILCQSCIDDIINDPFGRCLVCAKPTAKSQLCRDCRRFANDAWVVGERAGALEKLVDISKFESNRRGCSAQAVLLNATIPRLPDDTAVVPVPTTPRHIRMRGYGHMELVAKELSRLRGYKVLSALERVSDTVQHGADKTTRKAQAKEAFKLSVSRVDTPILLIDDVYTTGSTLRAAIKLLRKVSTKPVYIAVTTRQLLD